ncbi:MAG: UvrB/UvrC motif-containing protein [Saprospiraceae bacterium]|nr:UvrB/UvrC motif-containing protein [Saprospiraceae bacterium]
MSKKSGPLSSYSIDALKTMLDEVLGEENYEKAARIRDEINKRTLGS